LLGGRGDTEKDSSKESGLSAALLTSWLTYQRGGKATIPSAPDVTGNNLDTAS
jgi:hypothetical protein